MQHPSAHCDQCEDWDIKILNSRGDWKPVLQLDWTDVLLYPLGSG